MKPVRGVGPALGDGLQVLHLVQVKVDEVEGLSFNGLSGVSLSDEGLEHDGLGVALEHVLLHHMLEHESHRLVKRELARVDLQVEVLGLLVGVADAGEVGDLASTSLLVETLDVAGFTNLEGGADVALEELEAGVAVDLLGEVAVLGVGGDKCDEHNNASHVEELGDF